MRSVSFSRKLTGAAVALALCTSSTGAIAASAPTAHQATISPLVALSALGSDASRAALCGAAITAAASAAAQAAQQGCVLPVADAAPPPQPVADALPPPPVPPPPVAPMGGSGFGISPLLLALAGITAAVLLALALKGKKDEESPA